MRSEPPKISIEHLGKHRSAIPEITAWLHTEWGHLMPEISIEKLDKIFEGRLTPRQIPETYVAIANGKIVGTASLVEHDMITRLDISPWLAAVYIKVKYRNLGIGSKLVRAIMDEATQLGFEHFYLFTPDRASFYTRLGWQILEETEYRGECVTVMAYEVS